VLLMNENESNETLDGRRLAARLGRLGVWSGLLNQLTAAQEQAFARQVEGLGLEALWIPEGAGGKEVFSHAGVLLAGSQRLVIASGIANIWARDAMAMANGARTLAEAYPGRFVLGIGVSHAPAVASRGGRYERPFQHMQAYLEAMQSAPFGGPVGSEPAPWVLAALGPRMLRLAAERTLGAHPYFVPVEHTAEARHTLGPSALLAVEQAVVFETDAGRAREIARGYTRRYLAAANYANNLRRLGWADGDLDPATAGSDRLVDAVVAWGDLDRVAARVREHLAAGADHVCVQVLTAEPDPAQVVDGLGRLARLDWSS
jgi:probable F420-dependent oxidoreductase